jgi:NhaA family Na+:H+ antiporter
MLVVAIFYTRQVDFGFLSASLVPLAGLTLLNIFGFRRGWIYVALGAVLWVCLHHSGVHATLAGLLIAWTIPARTQVGQSRFTEKMRAALTKFERTIVGNAKILESSDQHTLAMDLEGTVRSAVTPLQRWHSILLNPVGIVIVPLFALFSAGVSLSPERTSVLFSSPVALGILAGLAVGKPLGITLFTLLALRLRIGALPRGLQMGDIVAVGMFSGIGFTMSLFVTGLSFGADPASAESAKLGILAGSLVSALGAWLWSSFLLRYRDHSNS